MRKLFDNARVNPILSVLVVLVLIMSVIFSCSVAISEVPVVDHSHEWEEFGDSAYHRAWCSECGGYVFEEHTDFEWFSIDECYHKRICSTCGYTEVALHNYTNHTSGPSSLEGEHYEYCDLCHHELAGSREKHTYNSMAPDHRCTKPTCNVNVFGDLGEPVFHYFPSGSDYLECPCCANNGYFAYLEEVDEGALENLEHLYNFSMIEGPANIHKYVLKSTTTLNFIPYKNKTGELHTFYRVVKPFVHGNYEFYARIWSQIKDKSIAFYVDTAHHSLYSQPKYQEFGDPDWLKNALLDGWDIYEDAFWATVGEGIRLSGVVDGNSVTFEFGSIGQGHYIIEPIEVDGGGMCADPFFEFLWCNTNEDNCTYIDDSTE